MTEEQRRDRMLGRCILIGFFWLGLHLYVAYRNFRDSLYVTHLNYIGKNNGGNPNLGES